MSLPGPGARAHVPEVMVGVRTDLPAAPGGEVLADSEIPALSGLEHGTGAVAHAHLGEDAGYVVLDRALGDVERQRDLAVGVAAGDEAEDLALAPWSSPRSERRRRDRGAGAASVSPRRLFSSLTPWSRCSVPPAASGAHRGRPGAPGLTVLEQISARAAADGLERHALVVEGGEHQRGRAGDPGRRASSSTQEAVPARHAHVEDEHVGRGSPSPSPRSLRRSPPSAVSSMSPASSSRLRRPTRTTAWRSSASTARGSPGLRRGQPGAGARRPGSGRHGARRSAPSPRSARASPGGRCRRTPRRRRARRRARRR